MKDFITGLIKFIQFARSYEILPSDGILLYFLYVCWFKSRKKFSVVKHSVVFVKKKFELWISMLGHYLLLGLDCFSGQLEDMTWSCSQDARIMETWWDEFAFVSQSKTNSPHIFHLFIVCSVKGIFLLIDYDNVIQYLQALQNCSLVVTSQQNKFILQLNLVITAIFTAAHQQAIRANFIVTQKNCILLKSINSIKMT